MPAQAGIQRLHWFSGFPPSREWQQRTSPHERWAETDLRSDDVRGRLWLFQCLLSSTERKTQSNLIHRSMKDLGKETNVECRTRNFEWRSRMWLGSSFGLRHSLFYILRFGL